MKLARTALLNTTTLVAVASAVMLAACGSSDGETKASQGKRGSSQVPAREPAPDVSRRIQTDIELAAPGQRVTLLQFPGVGQLEARCGERPEVAFKVKDRGAAVGVDTGRSQGKVQTLSPSQRLRTRLASSALQRWHIGSRHGDGDRVLTVSVQVTPVVGGRGNCMFTAQSTRTGRIP